MERSSTAVALCRAILAGIVAADVAFVAPAWSPMRVLWYQPLAHRWVFAVRPIGLGMDWYGRSLIAIAAAIVVFAILYLWGRRRAIGENALPLWTAWVLVTTMLVMSLYAFQLVPRRPVPEPLPAGYVPR